MFENTCLRLSGHGYLHDIHYQGDQSCVKLHLTPQLNGSTSDDIWLECRFNRDHFPIFDKLNPFLEHNDLLTLKFDAKYSGFQTHHVGILEDNSSSLVNRPFWIVLLKCELLTIHDYYVEARNPAHHNKHGIKNNPILHFPRT